MADDRAAHHDTLPLTSRQRARPSREQRFERERCGGGVDLAVDLVGRALAQPQREAHVLAHVEMRVERVALEHHRDVAIARLELVHAAAADCDLARRDRFETRDHSQQRRLAATGRADEHEELAVGDVEVDPLHHGDAVEALGKVADLHGRHRVLPISPRRASGRAR